MISIVNIFEQQQYNLYIDMDGVLTDFISRIQDIGYTGPFPGYGTSGEKDLWARIIRVGPKFWSKMNWLPDGKKLWDYVLKYNPTILTSVGLSLTSKLGRDGTQGKREWLVREMGQKVADKTLIVDSKKYRWATPNSILIDDSEKQIKEFREKGGIGILHTSTDKTIKELKKIGL